MGSDSTSDALCAPLVDSAALEPIAASLPRMSGLPAILASSAVNSGTYDSAYFKIR